MLLMIEEGIRCGMCQSTHRYAKANNKYMKNYDKSIESSYLIYLVLIIFTRKKKIGKSRKISLQYRRQRKICHLYISFKTKTKQQINTKRCAQSS